MVARVNSVGGALTAFTGGDSGPGRKPDSRPGSFAATGKGHSPATLLEGINPTALVDAVADLSRGSNAAVTVGGGGGDSGRSGGNAHVDVTALDGFSKGQHNSRINLSSQDPGKMTLDKKVSDTLATSAKNLVLRASSLLEIMSDGSSKEPMSKKAPAPDDDVDDYVLGDSAVADGGGGSASKDAWGTSVPAGQTIATTVLDAVSDFNGPSV